MRDAIARNDGTSAPDERRISRGTPSGQAAAAEQEREISWSPGGASYPLMAPVLLPIDEVGRLESQYDDLSMAGAYDDPRRFDEDADAYAQFKGYADARAYQDALTEHVREHGIVNGISIGSAYYPGKHPAGVVNGMHRYFAARDAGLTHVPVQPQRPTPLPPVPGWDYPEPGVTRRDPEPEAEAA
jgi:hypothetical protein